MLKVIEDLYVDLVIWSMLLQKFTKSIAQIILLGKFENRLTYLLTKPYYGLSDELWSPFA